MSIVGAIATVHAPFIAGMPELAPDDQRAAVDAGFERLRSFLADCHPDVIVTVASEHITNFLSDEAPAFAISTAPDNPTQPEFGLPDRRVPGDRGFAGGLVEFAAERGFPLTAYDELYLDHGTNLPLKFLRPEYDIPVVPIIVNTVWSPFPSTGEAYDLGALVARYVSERSPDTRVVIVGTGGISHWVGNRNHGRMNGDFDRSFVELILRSDDDALRSMSDEQIEAGGDGAHEVRTWITAAGAASASDLEPEIVLEEPFVPGWNVGVYQMVWKPSNQNEEG